MKSIQKVNYQLCVILTTIFISSLTFTAHGSNAPTLQLGDKAPELQYGKWLKGTPLKLDVPGRLYVVEFWATWCGPCIASMPHLSAFAKSHKDEATVIGVDIWEGLHEDDSTKQYDSYLSKVSKFVKGMGDKMGYNVVMDNNAQFMGNNWMKAAGQDGIPCSFMIKDGIILWIGHPINLDSMITIVNSKTYNVAAARKVAMEEKEKNSGAEEQMKNLFGAYEKASKAKDFKRAIDILDSGSVTMPAMAGTFGFFKAQTLIENFNEDTAMAFIKQWQSGKPGYVGSITAVISRKTGLKKETYLYAIDIMKARLGSPEQIPAFTLNEIATAYANMGDYKNAVDAEQQAVDSAKGSKDEKLAGFLTQDKIEELETALAGYKKKLQ